MPTKVFISCGQRPPDETEIAKKIRNLLKDKFELDSYLAFKVQSFDDVMQITRELSICDYFLFIDFRRDCIGRRCFKRVYRGSLFTHQELVLAKQLGFSEIIALQQDGVILEGFAQYILSNPEKFKDNNDLLKKVETLVSERQWSKDYSRNLVVGGLAKNPPILYSDHSTVAPRNEVIWHCRILNKRSDKAAVNTLAILNSITLPSGQMISPDKTFLKWAFQLEDYSRTIFPQSEASFDLLSVEQGNPLNVYLHSRLDTYLPNTVGTISRVPIVNGQAGTYGLLYKVFAEDFPILEFQVELQLTGNIDTTEARLLT